MQMLINGKFVDSLNGGTMQILNPATGKLVDTVPQANQDDVEIALEVAVRGREIMRRLPAHRRSDILRRAADRIAAEHESLSQLLCSENGKTIRQCRGEMTATQRLFLDFSEEAKRMRGQTIPMDAVEGLEHMIAYTIRQPMGLVVGIVPFNYPAELFAHKVPGALAAGNSVIVKLPEQCPLTVLQLGRILLESGLPPEGIQMLTGHPRDLGDRLITHPEVAMISFTGGVAAAKGIAKLAANSLKRTAFELGGVDAMVVLEDANIDAAAAAVIQGRLTNGAGQICCAVKRVLVDQKIMKPFVDAVVEKAKAIKMGDPSSEQTDLGPLITPQAAERVHLEVQKSIELGAKCLIGGHRVGDNFYEPTVLVEVDSAMPCLLDEVFGPVAPIVPFQSVGEAIRVVNESPYGLQASVFSENIHNALTVANRLEVGGVVVNGPGSFRPGNVPFGGFKQSGIGRESITDTIREMSHETAVVLNQQPTFTAEA
ncbi:aldehyde dehydrogenase family protein [Terriglobus sp. TAA 43]|uniref:aldehyde dehydrogenase family protein n=1 Tax=Terriglobus sp. TAA 43 TaxID=278961 RepID=UPI000647AEA2|nr:aldehyde dehydrogenase family protein [Terriglobus sp. TAA 43]